MPQLNDIHSQLNPTQAARVLAPQSLADVQAALAQARDQGLPVAISGGRHAMGGQQFAQGGLQLDMRAMQQVLHADGERGLLRMQAGAMWPDVIAAARAMPHAPGSAPWAIRQKQTGVDLVSLGGSISANAHGRGLGLQPLGGDIEDLQLLLPNGELRHCSRNENAELFALAVGGYGLFGVICSATLRLSPRQRVRRLVDVLDLEDAQVAIWRRIEQGCTYGDFQFVIDADDPRFLTRGVMACYEPVSSAAPCTPAPTPAAMPAELSREDWLSLLRLAHVDKAAAFRHYAQHYLGTHGQIYDSDTLQLATYLPDYADLVHAASTLPPHAPVKETLVIGEHYVPFAHIGRFMRAAQAVLRGRQAEVIYGTIRAIAQDTTSFLPWARQPSACVVFNLRTPHTEQGLARTASAFRGLIDAALKLGGSYFLTYHRHATARQLLRAHPKIRAFAARKQALDPQGLLCSDWWRHIQAQLSLTVAA
jgi:FAD/FMN-containing dehydrogenase